MDPALSPDDLLSIQVALAHGSRLLAVKLYRKCTGASLAEAERCISGLVAKAAQATPPSVALLDQVVALSTRGAGHATQQEQDHLQGRWPASHLAEAQRMVRELSNHAFALCEQCRNGLLSYDEVLTRLKTERPGFSHESYELIRAQAMADSR